MVNITRENGVSEPFDKERLVQSIINADVDEKIAREVADTVNFQGGTHSSDLRKEVTLILMGLDPKLANVYATKGKLSAKKATESKKGTAQLNPTTMERLKVTVGEIIDIFTVDKTLAVTVEEAHHPREEIHLHEADIIQLDAADGIQLRVRRRF